MFITYDTLFDALSFTIISSIIIIVVYSLFFLIKETYIKLNLKESSELSAKAVVKRKFKKRCNSYNSYVLGFEHLDVPYIKNCYIVEIECDEFGILQHESLSFYLNSIEGDIFEVRYVRQLLRGKPYGFKIKSINYQERY